MDSLWKFDYGPAHASKNYRYTYVCQQKRVNPMEIVESSYKRFKSCFLAIASFHKSTSSKAIISCFSKTGCGP